MSTKSKVTKGTKVEPIVPKKRGRKPKGGKIITVTETVKDKHSFSTNVVVHLKCKQSDIYPNEEEQIAPNVSSYSNNEEDSFQKISHKQEYDDSKNIHDKLKKLQLNLHNNNVCDTDSACFWCTCNFSNLPIYIPKFEINNTYHVYGCFCSPECATAYLMNENIDSSIKFERYHLLCYIYGKIYDYETNIKPAPDPRYTLKKYFGNLSVEEYRQLFDSQRYLFIIDKPITRELPELHEEYKNENKFSYTNKSQIIYQTFNA